MSISSYRLNEPLQRNESRPKNQVDNQPVDYESAIISRYVVLSSSNILNLIYTFLIIGLFLTFLLFNLLHADRRQFNNEGIRRVVTLSDTGSYPPEQFIFTFLLHSLAVLFVVLFTAVKVSFAQKIMMNNALNDNPNGPLSFYPVICRCLANIIWCGPADSKADLLMINTYLWIIGLLTALFLALVGTIPLTSSPTGHGVSALLMVIFGVIYMIFFYLKLSRSIWIYAGSQAFRSSSHYFWCQYIGLILIIPVELAIGITSAILSSTCYTTSCQYFASDTFPYLEYVAMVAFIIYIEGFRYEVQGVILNQAPTSALVSHQQRLYEV